MSLKKYFLVAILLSAVTACSLFTVLVWLDNKQLIIEPEKWRRSQELNSKVSSVDHESLRPSDKSTSVTKEMELPSSTYISSDKLLSRKVNTADMATLNLSQHNIVKEHHQSVRKNISRQESRKNHSSTHRKGNYQPVRKINDTFRWENRRASKHRKQNGKIRYCTPETCLSGLTNRDDHWMHASCFDEAFQYLQKSLNSTSSVKMSKCSCNLLEKENYYKRIALVSLPGSGNTWVRGLLERATNICTGSMWCDPNLRASQFCGEGLRSTKTLVVKIHDSTFRWRGEILPQGPDFSEYNKPEFDAAIFVHRNPFDSIVADHNRALGLLHWEASVNNGGRLPSSFHSHHVTHYGKEFFGENVMWNRTINRLMKRWEEMVNHLLIKSLHRPVLLVHYEDVKSNSLYEVMRMLKFLHYDVPEDSLRERLQKQFNTFYRNHSSASFEHFTLSQQDRINGYITRMASKLIGKPLKLDAFIRS